MEKQLSDAINYVHDKKYSDFAAVLKPIVNDLLNKDAGYKRYSQEKEVLNTSIAINQEVNAARAEAGI